MKKIKVFKEGTYYGIYKDLTVYYDEISGLYKIYYLTNNPNCWTKDIEKECLRDATFEDCILIRSNGFFHQIKNLKINLHDVFFIPIIFNDKFTVFIRFDFYNNTVYCDYFVVNFNQLKVKIKLNELLSYDQIEILQNNLFNSTKLFFQKYQMKVNRFKTYLKF